MGYPKTIFEHHNHRRKFGHDYRAPWKYHITVTKAPGCQDFSEIVVKELTPGGIHTRFSALGMVIWRAIRYIQDDRLSVIRFAIMPDHLHLLVHVKQRLDEHLGLEISRLKGYVTRHWRNKTGNDCTEVFDENYNDRIILPEHSLDDVYKYIENNPYRLAVRRMRPDFFSKTRGLEIDGRECQGYGNLFFLRNPFRIALVVHRKDSDKEFWRKRDECLYYAANGGVVVSAFISQRERAIRKEIEAIGGRIILIHDRPFADRQKPARHEFGQCSQGRLLMVSAMEYQRLPKREHPSREQCLDMNKLALALAPHHAGTPPELPGVSELPGAPIPPAR